MALIPGTNIGAPVVPFDTADDQASHEAVFGKGGYRTVADATGLTDIKGNRLEEGMLVYREDNQAVYQLQTGFSTPSVIGDWAIFTTATGGLNIGDAVGGATPGSFMFIDPLGQLGEDNNYFFIDEVDVKFGLGTNTPSALYSSVAYPSKQLTGTASITSGTTAVTGVGTLFTTELARGDTIRIGTDPSQTKVTVFSITDDTNLVIDTNFNLTESGVSIFTDWDYIQLSNYAGGSKFLMNKTGTLHIGDGAPDPRTGTGISARGIHSGTTALQIAQFVNHNLAAVGMEMYTHADAGFRAPTVNLYKSRGTEAAPTPPINYSTLGYFNFGGYDGVSYTSGASLRAQASENWAAGTNKGSLLSFDVTENGTTTARTTAQLQGDGNFVFGTPLSSPEAMMRINSYPAKQLTGTVSIPGGTPNVTGVGTLFTSELNVGDSIRFDYSHSQTKVTVIAIASDTSLTLSANFNITYSGVLAFTDYNYLHLSARTGQEKFRIDKGGVVHNATTAGITASIVQAQGEQILSSAVNEVSTVANAGDAVTLQTDAGNQIVINNGANSMDVYPPLGGNIEGAGANLPNALAAGARATYVAFSTTEWARL